jgi:hypothetical protein
VVFLARVLTNVLTAVETLKCCETHDLNSDVQCFSSEGRNYCLKIDKAARAPHCSTSEPCLGILFFAAVLFADSFPLPTEAEQCYREAFANVSQIVELYLKDKDPLMFYGSPVSLWHSSMHTFLPPFSPFIHSSPFYFFFRM